MYQRDDLSASTEPLVLPRPAETARETSVGACAEIAAIPDACNAIEYTDAVDDDATDQSTSRTEVAEVSFTLPEQMVPGAWHRRIGLWLILTSDCEGCARSQHGPIDAYRAPVVPKRSIRIVESEYPASWSRPAAWSAKPDGPHT